MTISSADKGGRELAAAWLRRVGAEPRIVGGVRKRTPVSDVGRSASKPESGAVFHSETHVGFSRA